MRLYDTATRRLQELPPPPGPIRMYFCGPTVYQRIHIGNARPFVISLWLKRWLERSGYDVTLVENITDINDKIYDAAPGDSARLAADASAWYVDDTGDLGLGRPDVEPKATRDDPGDRGDDRATGRVRPRIPGERRLSTFGSRASPTTASSRAATATRRRRGTPPRRPRRRS
jgi:hypothetical protein